MDVTTEYLKRLKPDFSHTLLKDWDVPENRTPVARLSWIVLDDLKSSSKNLEKTFSISSLPDAHFFLDSSFLLGSSLPVSFWQSLLTRKVVITESVWNELQPWVNSPQRTKNDWMKEQLIIARKNASSMNIVFLNRFDDAQIEAACQYYSRVLCERKHADEYALSRLRKRLKREPEASELATEIQRIVKDRGIQLANDGIKAKRQNNPNIFNDEDLVVRAVLWGISTGSEIGVLTKDRGINEQFYKLVYLIDTNYRSMLVGKRFVEQPRNFPAKECDNTILKSIGWTDVTQIKLPRGFQRWLLPKECQFVMLNCFRFSHLSEENCQFSQLGFCAETQMSEILKVKGNSQGLNSDKLAGKNCVHYLHPDMPLNGHAIIGTESLLEIRGQRCSWVDLNIAFARGEGCARVATVENEGNDYENDHQIYLGRSLAEFRPDIRLGFTGNHSRKLTISDQAIASAIATLDPTTIIAMDSSAFFGGWLEKTENSIESRAICVPPHIDGGQGAAINLRETYWPHGHQENPDYSFAFKYYRSLILQRRSIGRTLLRGDEDLLPPKQKTAIWEDRISQFPNFNSWLRRARSGFKRVSDSKLFLDDVSLVDAALTAIIEGCDLVFLTRRPSVFEQFYTLGLSISNDYRSFCWSETIYETGKRFAAPQSSDRFREIGFSTELTSFEVETNGEDHFPKASIPVTLSCWLLVPENNHSFQFYHGAFLGERPMCQLLKIKSQSRGRNTNRHGDYNFRVVARKGESETLWIGRDIVWPTSELRRGIPDCCKSLVVDEIPKFDLIDSQNRGDPIAFPWQGRI